MKLGTATWIEGGRERRALITPLPSDPERWVDLHAVERVRQAKLGEGRADALAEALVPPSLRLVLEGGVRTLQRLRTTLAYAEKWARKATLPVFAAPPRTELRLLPCLPRPASLLRADGTHLDRLSVQGPGGTLQGPIRPTLALVGAHPHRPVGACLVAEGLGGVALGGWLELDLDWKGALSMTVGAQTETQPLEAWQGLALRPLRPGELLLLPAPEWKTFGSLRPGSSLTIQAPFETLPLRCGRETLHPTIQ